MGGGCSVVATSGGRPDIELTEREKALIRRSWKLLCEDSMTMIGGEIFLKIFELNNEVKALFPFRDVTGEALKHDPDFKGHASRFMQALGAAVDNLDNLRHSLEPLLSALGKTHTRYTDRGFTPAFFDEFTASILHVWRERLGRKFTPEVRAAWLAMVSFIATAMKDGYRKVRWARVEEGNERRGSATGPVDRHKFDEEILKLMAEKETK
ncbi:PREDICTED: neuroglobin-like [Priapulus caudatus]|uniref:Neuroglobin-like n=1 Tax=Priapulus caudatus TaxID=37621 RepID=A0ABM1EWS3_PRICU|nr:PREDICTED: neuroglobin-like [Priapulus caudatus]